MDNKAIEFSQYRLERAKETLNTAKVIFDIKKIIKVLIIGLIMLYFMQLERY